MIAPYVTTGILSQIVEVSEFQKIKGADMVPTVTCEAEETIEPIAPRMDRFMSEQIRKEVRICEPRKAPTPKQSETGDSLSQGISRALKKKVQRSVGKQANKTSSTQ